MARCLLMLVLAAPALAQDFPPPSIAEARDKYEKSAADARGVYIKELKQEGSRLEGFLEPLQRRAIRKGDIELSNLVNLMMKELASHRLKRRPVHVTVDKRIDRYFAKVKDAESRYVKTVTAEREKLMTVYDKEIASLTKSENLEAANELLVLKEKAYAECVATDIHDLVFPGQLGKDLIAAKWEIVQWGEAVGKIIEFRDNGTWYTPWTNWYGLWERDKKGELIFTPLGGNKAPIVIIELSHIELIMEVNYGHRMELRRIPEKVEGR